MRQVNRSVRLPARGGFTRVAVRPLGVGRVALAVVMAAMLLAGCTQTLGEEECARYRERLRTWAEKRGKVDRTAAESFTTSCVGSTLSRRTAKCLDRAQDEAAFFRCLE